MGKFTVSQNLPMIYSLQKVSSKFFSLMLNCINYNAYKKANIALSIYLSMFRIIYPLRAQWIRMYVHIYLSVCLPGVLYTYYGRYGYI